MSLNRKLDFRAIKQEKKGKGKKLYLPKGKTDLENTLELLHLHGQTNNNFLLI